MVRANPAKALWIAVAVLIAGRLVDLQWHLTHDEFEGASEQIRAHFLAWIGVLLVLGVTAVAICERVRGLGYRLALGGAGVYAFAAVWHFVEHANGNDPELAHVLVSFANLAMIMGAIVAVGHRRARRLSD
jgi:hypothetical protein